MMQLTLMFESGKGLLQGERVIALFAPILCDVVKQVDESGSEQVFYNIQVSYLDGSLSQMVQVKSLSRIDYFQHFGVQDALLNSKAKKILEAYLQMQYPNVPKFERKNVQRTGLFSGHLPAYVFDRKRMLNPNGVEIKCDDTVPEFPVAGECTKEQQLEYISRLLKLQPGVSDILFMLEIFSKLKPLFEEAGIPVDFSGAIYGRPGTYKTTLAKLVHVGDDTQFLSFADTKKTIREKTLARFEGHTVVVDDYHAQAESYMSKKQQGIADCLARYNGFSKGAFVVTTGEFIEGLFSMQDRLVPIRVSKPEEGDGAIYLSNLNWLQENRGVLWNVFWEFCKDVYADPVSVEELLLKKMQSVKNTGKYRIGRNLDILALSYNVFECWLNSEKTKEWEEQIANSLQRVQSDAMRRMKTVEQMERGIDWAKVVHCVLPQDTGKNTVVQGYYYEKSFLFILPDRLKKLIEAEMECKVKLGEVVSDLANKGLLYMDKSKDRTVKRMGIGHYGINIDRLNIYISGNK